MLLNKNKVDHSMPNVTVTCSSNALSRPEIPPWTGAHVQASKRIAKLLSDITTRRSQRL